MVILFNYVKDKDEKIKNINDSTHALAGKEFGEVNDNPNFTVG